jgi:cobalt-zinc-cadmium efflux system membrane fusion protein
MTDPDVQPGRRPLLARRPLMLGLAVMVLGAVAVMVWPRRPPAASAAPGAPGDRDVPYQDGKLIRFSEKFATRSGLSVETARLDSMSPTINVTGTLAHDGLKFAAVGARISGRVRKLYKLEGDKVEVDEVLAEVESAELGRAEAHVLATRAKEKAAAADSKRERRLADAHITAERDAEAAKATFDAARAERVAAERAVQALGGDLDREIGVLELRSPIAGRVVTSKVARGQTVEPSDTLFEVADLGSLWVELRVFERDVGAVRAGDPVEVTPQSDAGRGPLDGKVARVGDVIEVETRTAGIRVVVDNAGGRLRPGQSVRARIHTSAAPDKLLVLPRQAVTRIDGKPTVFVALDRLTVEPRGVTTGPEDGERVAIVEGLAAGDKVVVGGMFALKSELFR